jgi:hypothetical protein
MATRSANRVLGVAALWAVAGCARPAPRVPLADQPSVELLDQDWGGGSAPEAAPMAGRKPDHTITGTIVLASARRPAVRQGDTIFISARRRGASGITSLVAAQRLEARDFPLAFILGAEDAMVPGTEFAGSVDLTVRVDKDGDPLTRRRGDVYGVRPGVRVGDSNVVITLDRLQSDDVTLAGGQMPVGNSLPVGHP